MCLPAVAAAPALLGTQIAGQALGFVGQTQAANAQAKYQNSQYAAVTASALDSYVNQLRLGQERIGQEEEAASRESTNNTREASRGAGRAAVTAAANGVSGQTAQELVREFHAIEADNENALRTNLEWTRSQIGEQFHAIRSNTQSRISAAAPKPVQRPSPFALALGIGGSLLNNQVRASQNTPPGQDLPDTLDAVVGLF